MFSKIFLLFFILCIYNISAITYEEALKGCKAQFKLENDDPLDNFMKNGEFDAGKENLKCFFECLASSLSIKSADGSINAEALKKTAQEHTHCQELALFSSDSVLQACAKPYPAPESCDKILGFVQCAIQLKNNAPKQ